MTLDEILQRDFFPYPDLVRLQAAARPRHPALIQDDGQDGRALDYAGLDARMDRIAAALQRDGIEPGDAVAICAGTSIEYAAVYLGALRAGAAVAPISPSGTAESIERMGRDSGASVFFDDAKLARLDDWLAGAAAAPKPVEIRPDAPFNI